MFDVENVSSSRLGPSRNNKVFGAHNHCGLGALEEQDRTARLVVVGYDLIILIKGELISRTGVMVDFLVKELSLARRLLESRTDEEGEKRKKGKFKQHSERGIGEVNGRKVARLHHVELLRAGYILCNFLSLQRRCSWILQMTEVGTATVSQPSKVTSKAMPSIKLAMILIRILYRKRRMILRRG